MTVKVSPLEGVFRGIALTAGGAIVLAAVSWLAGQLPVDVPSLATLLVLAAFSYPVGLATTQLAELAGLVCTDPDILLSDGSALGMQRRWWNSIFVGIHRRLTGNDWTPVSREQFERVSVGRGEAGGSQLLVERLHGLLGISRASAIFGPCCLTAAVLLLVRGIGRLDATAFIFGMAALVSGLVLIVACWMKLGEAVSLSVPRQPARVPASEASAPHVESADNSIENAEETDAEAREATESVPAKRQESAEHPAVPNSFEDF